MGVRLPSWHGGRALSLVGASATLVCGCWPVTDALIKTHLFLHAVLPQLEEVVRVDGPAQAVVAGWRGSIALRVAGGPGVRLVVADGCLLAVRRARGLPSLGLLLPSPAAAVRMFEGGRAVPLPWIGAWRLRLISGLRSLSGRLQYYLKADRSQLDADDAFASAVRIRLGVLVYAIAVLAECWDEGRRIAASGAGEGVIAVGIADGPPLQLSSTGSGFTVSRDTVRHANVTVEFADVAAAFGILSGTLDLWTAIGTGAVRLRGNLLLLDPVLQLMARVGSFL